MRMVSLVPFTRSGFILVFLCIFGAKWSLGFQVPSLVSFQSTRNGRQDAILSSTWATDGSSQPVGHGRIQNSTFWESAIRGPPKETKPDYENIVGPLGRTMDMLFMVVFRKALAKHTNLDSDRPVNDFKGITDIALQMNRRYPDRTQVQVRALDVLKSLFPPGLPRAYAKLFSGPFPAFSARMNAWATRVAGTWLMGECEINDIVLEGPNGEEVVGVNQGLLVKRCRFLEESGCASVCVNSCKIPTQTFFSQEMGLALTMEPNYETFECQFSFGKMPGEQEELEAKNVPCLMRCPTAGSIRKQHGAAGARRNMEEQASEAASLRPCELMENAAE